MSKLRSTDVRHSTGKRCPQPDDLRLNILTAFDPLRRKIVQILEAQ